MLGVCHFMSGRDHSLMLLGDFQVEVFKKEYEE